MDEDYTDEQIRDWYAGQALIGLLACPGVRGVLTEISSACFDYADAMMAERKRRQPDQQPINAS